MNQSHQDEEASIQHHSRFTPINFNPHSPTLIPSDIQAPSGLEYQMDTANTPSTEVPPTRAQQRARRRNGTDRELATLNAQGSALPKTKRNRPERRARMEMYEDRTEGNRDTNMQEGMKRVDQVDNQAKTMNSAQAKKEKRAAEKERKNTRAAEKERKKTRASKRKAFAQRCNAMAPEELASQPPTKALSAYFQTHKPKARKVEKARQAASALAALVPSNTEDDQVSHREPSSDFNNLEDKLPSDNNGPHQTDQYMSLNNSWEDHLGNIAGNSMDNPIILEPPMSKERQEELAKARADRDSRALNRRERRDRSRNAAAEVQHTGASSDKEAAKKAGKQKLEEMGLSSTPGEDILEDYALTAPSPFDLSHFRDYLAANAAHFRMVCGDSYVTKHQASDPEYAADHQARRMFCYLEVVVNAHDNWSEARVKDEMDRINSWERMRNWNYARRGIGKKHDGGKKNKKKYIKGLQNERDLIEAFGRFEFDRAEAMGGIGGGN